MKNYSINVILNLYELDVLMGLLEEKEESNDISKKLYIKLENYMSNIKFLKKDKSVEKILEDQKLNYIRKNQR